MVRHMPSPCHLMCVRTKHGRPATLPNIWQAAACARLVDLLAGADGRGDPMHMEAAGACGAALCVCDAMEAHGSHAPTQRHA